MKKRLILFLVVISSVAVLVSAVHPTAASSGSWVEKAPMPTGRYAFGAVTVNGTIYAIGGLINMPEGYRDGHITTTTDVNEAYNPANDTWAERAPMPSPHWLNDFGMALCQDKIYCIGGPANNVYDPATDTWEAKTPMPASRHFLGANVVDDKIYLIGGLALGPAPAWQDKLVNDPRWKLITYSFSNVNEMYDPATDSWTEKAPIPIAVDSYVSAVADNRIYVISGRIGGETTDAVQVYDPLTDEWSKATPIPTPVEKGAAAMIANAGISAIYVVGGQSSEHQYNGSNLVQVYFPQNDSWTMCPPMPTNRTSLCVAVANNQLYAIGGMDWHGITAATFQFTLAETPESSSPSTETQDTSIPTQELTVAATAASVIVAISITIVYLKKRGASGVGGVKNP